MVYIDHDLFLSGLRQEQRPSSRINWAQNWDLLNNIELKWDLYKVILDLCKPDKYDKIEKLETVSDS